MLRRVFSYLAKRSKVDLLPSKTGSERVYTLKKIRATTLPKKSLDNAWSWRTAPRPGVIRRATWWRTSGTSWTS